MNAEVFAIVTHKLHEKGVNISDCNVESRNASRGSVGTENSYVFPLVVVDGTYLYAQSGCVSVPNASKIVSLIQLPILHGTTFFVSPIGLEIPLLVITPKITSNHGTSL